MVPSVLEVVAHPTGPWLVKAGKYQYAVPADLGQVLLPLTGRRPRASELQACLRQAQYRPWVRELDRALSPGNTRHDLPQNGRPLRFRIPLISAGVVGQAAGKLKFLTGDLGLATLALLGGGGYLVKLVGPVAEGISWDFGSLAVGLGLFLLSATWHELGHAAALARSGYPPGGIGVGILFVIPVLFADVTAVGVLPRAGRIRVDGSGVIFQFAAGGLFMALASLRGLSPHAEQALTLVGSSALLAVLWSLFPFIRSDGYWLLCDLLALEDLDRPPPVRPRAGLRIFLVGYQLTNALFLTMIALFFPWRMVSLLLGLVGRMGLDPGSTSAKGLAACAGLAFLGMMGLGITRRVSALLKSALAVARGTP